LSKLSSLLLVNPVQILVVVVSKANVVETNNVMAKEMVKEMANAVVNVEVAEAVVEIQKVPEMVNVAVVKAQW
jgi:hypothetical protein